VHGIIKSIISFTMSSIYYPLHLFGGFGREGKGMEGKGYMQVRENL